MKPEAKHLARSIPLFLASLVLIAAAIFTISQSTDALSSATDTIAGAPLPIIALALALPLLNLLLTSMVFWAATSRHRHVPVSDMTALIFTGWLLNNLPLRPGLLGRIAYHKAIHNIPATTSVRVIVEVLAATLVAAALLLFLSATLLTLPATASTPILVISAATISWLLADPRARWLAAAVLFRTLDLAVWAARYHLVFTLTGTPIEPAHVLAITLASQLAMLTPLQLGLREWTVALVASLLHTSAADPQLSAGLIADILNRGLELLVSLPAAAIAALYLSRRWRNAKHALPGPSQPRPHESV